MTEEGGGSGMTEKVAILDWCAVNTNLMVIRKPHPADTIYFHQ